ncbi:E3 ubiquitin-protein ligase UBR4-like [Tubulanus polymorphus]|uniref:E3 ubiquitin-protein ligase UBR4-like n=1 Tax=Tubulanus polymorphus TaxID=672921 RepID=UPI003DA54A8C
MMSLVRGLCRGEAALSKSDTMTITALLKSAGIPICDKPPADKVDPMKSDVKQEKKLRFPVTFDIFSQLNSAFNEAAYKVKSPLYSTVVPHGNDNVKSCFADHNVQIIQNDGGREMLLEMCLQNLPFLRRYILAYESMVSCGSMNFISTISEALSIKNSFQLLLQDIQIVREVFSLPLLEPLNVSRLEEIITIIMACLVAAIHTAAANAIITMSNNSSKEDELEASNIVKKSLEVYGFVVKAIQNSTRAGGHNLQNFHMLGTWCLLSGIQHILNLSPVGIQDKTSGTKSTREGNNTAGKQPDLLTKSKDSLVKTTTVKSVSKESIKVTDAKAEVNMDGSTKLMSKDCRPIAHKDSTRPTSAKG